MNKKTVVWVLVVVLLVVALLLVVNAWRSSGDAGAAPTQVPTSTPAPPPPTNPPADANAAIIDILWQWTQLMDQEVVTSVPDPAGYTIIFRSDETFTGTADCNQISGTYSTRSGFSINVKTSTSAYCGESSLDQMYLKTLGEVAAGGPDGVGGLALETAGGAKRMEFRNGGSTP